MVLNLRLLRQLLPRLLLRAARDLVSCIRLADVALGPAVDRVVAGTFLGVQRIGASQPLEYVGRVYARHGVGVRHRQGVGASRAGEPLHLGEETGAIPSCEVGGERRSHRGRGSCVGGGVRPCSTV